MRWILIEVSIFSFTLWLGFYLISRSQDKAYLKLIGVGLLSYALALASLNLQNTAPDEQLPLLQNLHTFLIFQPALLWAGGLLHLLPETSKARSLLLFWQYGQVLTTEVLILVSIFASFPLWALALISSLPLFIYLILLAIEKRKEKERYPLTLLIVGTIFFGLSTALLFHMNSIPRQWVIFAIGFDLELLGIGIAIYDAFDEGQNLRKDIFFSFQNALFSVLFFGVQIVLVMVLSTGLTFAMAALLYASVASAIFFSTHPPQRQARLQSDVALQLHATTNALARVKDDHEFSSMSEEAFARFTRRALSNLDNLPRLATSPLVQLPLLDQRLTDREAALDTLGRTNELKKLLIESIARLKPQSEDLFSPTDEWRYYNALYFPYVAGIKPSRRRQPQAGLPAHEAAALDWFQTQVPERTLHNWQNAAARLIAQDLRERGQL